MIATGCDTGRVGWMFFTREQVVTATIALVAGAAGAAASSNAFLALGLVAGAVFLGLFLQVPWLGRLIGVFPVIEFLGASTKFALLPWSKEAEVLYVSLRNKKGPDVRVHAELRFTTPENEPLFDFPIEARPSNVPLPDAGPLDLPKRTVELLSEEVPESFDVLAKYDSAHLGASCFVLNNESWFVGNHEKFRINAQAEFLVHVEVRGKLVRGCRSAWRVYPGHLGMTKRGKLE